MIDYKHKIFIKKIDKNYELKGIYINLSRSTNNSKNKLKPAYIALRFFLNNKSNEDNKLFPRYYKNITKYTDNEIWLFAQA